MKGENKMNGIMNGIRNLGVTNFRNIFCKRRGEPAPAPAPAPVGGLDLSENLLGNLKKENKMGGIGNPGVTNLQGASNVEQHTVRYKTEKIEKKSPFESGEYVRVTGLTNQTEYNGSDGMVHSVRGGKVNVILHNGNMIKIKPTNLEKLEKEDVFNNNLFQIACYGKTEDQDQIKYELVVAESLVNRCEYRKVTLSKHDKYTLCETAKDTITTPKMSINFPFWNCRTNNQGEEVSRCDDFEVAKSMKGNLYPVYPPNIATVFYGTRITDSYNEEFQKNSIVTLKLTCGTIIKLTNEHSVDCKRKR